MPLALLTCKAFGSSPKKAGLQLVEGVGLGIEIRKRNAAGAVHADGVAVGLGVHDLAVADGAAGARLVEHDHRDADLLAERVGDQPHADVAAAACRPCHDQRDRFGGERLCLRAR
jgi:hypothetical protein